MGTPVDRDITDSGEGKSLVTDGAGSKGTIVLIHGLWLASNSWDGWIERYTAAGYTAIAPEWPGLDGKSVEEFRRDPSPLGPLDVKTIVDHYAAIIRGLPEPPFIIGHSFGGVFTQLLLDRGLGKAGVALHSAQIKGVLPLPLRQLKAAAPVLRNPFHYGKPVPITEGQFHYAFTNTLGAAESKAYYDKLAIPAAGKLLFQAGMANFYPRAQTKVNLKNASRAPLLFIAGEKDNTVPPVVNRFNYRLQAKSGAITAYKEFPGRPHLTGGVPGWEEVADFARSWLEHPVAIAP